MPKPVCRVRTDCGAVVVYHRLSSLCLVVVAGLVLSGCAEGVAAPDLNNDPGDDDPTPDQEDRRPPARVRNMGVGINVGFYNPGAGMKVFRAGYNTAGWAPGDDAFEEAFLDDLAPFESIRYTQFHRASFSNDVDWSDRTPPSLVVPLTGFLDLALPYEWGIRLSNTLGTDHWLSIPSKATPEYIAALARLVHDQLDPGLKVYLEYSNEVWNPDFQEGAVWDDEPGFNGQYSVAEAAGLELRLSEDPDRARTLYYVYQSVRIWQIFEDIFDDDSRLVRVLATVNDPESFWEGNIILDGLSDPVINPNGARPDHFSLAAYVGITADGASPTLFEAELQNDLSNLLTGYGIARSGLDEAGYQDVRLNAYEGGTHILQNADVANRDVRVYALYRQMLDALEGAGLSIYHNFVHTSAYLEWDGFANKEFTGQPAEDAHKWRALRDWIMGL
jgi:hypothetical protein